MHGLVYIRLHLENDFTILKHVDAWIDLHYCRSVAIFVVPFPIVVVPYF